MKCSLFYDASAKFTVKLTFLKINTARKRTVFLTFSLDYPKYGGCSLLRKIGNYIKSNRRHIPEDVNLHQHSRENLKYRIFIIFHLIPLEIVRTYYVHSSLSDIFG